MNILYISDSYLSLSVFKSQVHTICNYHSKKHNITLIALCNIYDIKQEKPEDALYELIKLYRYPKMFIPIINRLRAFSSKNILNKILNRADVIHCRGHVSSAFAINLLKILKIYKPIIADIRGVIGEELLNRETLLSKFYYTQTKIIERYVFKYCDYLFFVSHNMQKYYMDKYDFKQHSAVFPTIVDEKLFYTSSEKRNIIRERLKISERLCYVYVGGVDYWQNLDKILLKFDSINKENQRKFFFIILTNNKQWVFDFCHKNGIKLDNFYIDSLPYDKVPLYLNAADFGVIIRNDDLINFVASPTKINEYLACGLKIINNLEQIGVNQKFLNVEYRNIKSIISEQDSVYSALLINKASEIKK